MNRLLLDDLQRRRCTPSITLLVNTRPGPRISAEDAARIDQFLAEAAARVGAEVDSTAGWEVMAGLRRLVREHLETPTPTAYAFCASPEVVVAVRLGREVRERVVIDDTFATRDLVADLNRTARWRAVTCSERRVRLLLGDRDRLLEVRDDTFPMVRAEDEGDEVWQHRVLDALRAEHASYPLPAVVAGVDRSVRRSGVDGVLMVVGQAVGNHDRTPAAELHRHLWPLVDGYLDTGRQRAMERLEQARSTRRYAGGIDEVWALAREGRVDLLVVEESFQVSARVDEHDQLLPADGSRGPGVVEDVVDDTIEAVLLRGGRAVMVPDDQLQGSDRIAAVLRY